MTTLCLTRAHIQVIAGYARGHDRARIGRDLHLAPGTVAQRLRRAARSVGIEGGDLAPQLIHYAYQHGYLDGLRPERRGPSPTAPAESSSPARTPSIPAGGGGPASVARRRTPLSGSWRALRQGQASSAR